MRGALYLVMDFVEVGFMLAALWITQRRRLQRAWWRFCDAWYGNWKSQWITAAGVSPAELKRRLAAGRVGVPDELAGRRR